MAKDTLQKAHCRILALLGMDNKTLKTYTTLAFEYAAIEI